MENPRQIDMLMNAAGPRFLGFAPDTAHLWLGGGDPAKIIDTYKDRLIYLHYKDANGFFRKPDYMDNVFELGQGTIDFPAIQRILKSVNYRGWIAIDLDNPRGAPLKAARNNKRYIDSVLDTIHR